MNSVYIVMGLIEILFAIFLAFLTFIIAFKLLSIFTIDYDDEKEIKQNNTAVGILSAAFIICIGISLREAAIPTLSIIKTTILAPDVTGIAIARAIGFILLHLFTANFVSILSMFISILLVIWLSPFKSLKPIKDNNIALALIISATIIVTTLLIAQPLLTLLSGMIPGEVGEMPLPM